jgi:hypothetical protein
MKVSHKVQSPSASAKATADKKSKVHGDASAPAPDLGPWNLELGTSRREGVALVITLIMLSIITFMAVTFLVLSQRERSASTGTIDTKISRNAADAALARVSAELLTRMMVQTNFQDFDLMVSTNYINLNGFVDGLPPNPTNVNYDYEINGVAMTNVGAVPWERNIADLLYNPRPPVFVVTNKGTGGGEFRYYFDANRNGRFDRNGTWPIVVTDAGGNPAYLSTNTSGQLITVATNVGGWIFSNAFVGDPEWIGVLERPAEMHSADNRFIARYAYVVVPIGKALDINYMHNESMTRAANPSPGTALTIDGFLRNQGTGPWEENLASFLVDLNTNEWDATPNIPGSYYQYNEGDPQSPFFPSFNKGVAFDDARALLSYRYANNYASLSRASSLFPAVGIALQNDNIDEYSDGPLMTGLNTNESSGPDKPIFPWPGADNTNHYFTTQDVFNKTKTQLGVTAPGMSDRLQFAGTSNDTYNAYTYFRLLSQLGTDSSPDQGKININYRNTDKNGNIVPGLETNLTAWTPIDFFISAATALFQEHQMRDFNGNLITVTNIPVYEIPTQFGGTNINYYTPAVHRILQLAANIYDATTNRFLPRGTAPTNYPSVFRPVFRSQNGIASIIGFVEVTNSAPAFYPFLDPTNFATVNQLTNNTVNLYGVPWVVGAKKGFPNFNEMSMENPFTVTRKLQFTNQTSMPPWQTNQLFDFSITNSFGVEAWNSYTNAYGRPLRLVVTNELTVVVTNQLGITYVNVTNRPYGNDITTNSWPGWGLRRSDNSFKVPLMVSDTFTNATYLQHAPFVVPLAPPQWDASIVPHIWIGLQFRFRYCLIDTSVDRVIDFVNVVDTQPEVDISAMLAQGASGGISLNLADEWATNSARGNALVGIMNQIFASEGQGGTISDWHDTPANIAADENTFRKWINNGGTNSFQAPYSPARTVFQHISLQANDPLVHYMGTDLTSTNGALATHNHVDLNPQTKPLDNLNQLNLAYQPWGGNITRGGAGSQNPNPTYDENYQVKDPLVYQSDNWDFPTNKLANIGWMGRIHRGTPWQTVYMKSANITVNDWKNWANDNITNINTGAVDALLTHPTDDYALFDLFTTAINENASRSRLNVNQTGLASWSAILGGVNVLSNSPGGMVSMTIPPAGVYDPSNNPSPMAAIWQGINNTRANTNLNFLVFPNHTFQHMGDVLATPQLSVASPFLNTNGLATPGANGISDEMMERIPQQVMSLLTLNQTPRFVIYSYGQTLHPADHSLVIGGTFNGLCTNYQITAESATRAVVRVEGSPDPQYTNDVVHPHPDPQGRFYPPRIVVEQFNVLGPD